jgi:hypothetical protein
MSGEFVPLAQPLRQADRNEVQALVVQELPPA